MPVLPATPQLTGSYGSFTFYDWRGRQRSTRIQGDIATTGADWADVADALGNASNAQVIEYNFGEFHQMPNLSNITVYDEAYPTVGDVAVFQYADDNGVKAQIELCAPDASIFEADGFTVKLSSTLVTAINNAVVTALGGTFAYVRGFYAQRKVPRDVVRTTSAPTEPGLTDNPPPAPGT